MAQKNYSSSELFTLANRIRRTNGCTQKEAFALAKAQLTADNSDSSLYDTLMAKMKSGNVKFTYKNNKGQNITTTGTMQMNKVPTTRKVEGKKTAKNENMTVFYDVRHGVYRQFDKNCIVAIVEKK